MKKYLIILFIAMISLAPSNAVYDQASDIETDTTNFDGKLSGSDSDVQAALDTLDDKLTSVPEYSADPASPSANDVWVLHSGNSAGQSLGIYPLTITSADTGSYTLRYRTEESTTIGVSLT